MRAPAPSFKSNIVTYRDCLVEGNPPHDAHYRVVMGILDRWERHPEVEAIWDKIKPSVPPEIFILGILQAGRVAEKVDRLVHELPSAEKKSVSRVKRFLTEKQFRPASRLMALLHDVREGRKRLLSRKTETAARTHFMVTLRDYFSVQFGQPFDDVVATLTNIVFDLQPRAIGLPREHTEVTADHVRDAERAARKRDIRPPK
jgi:hypothetical protein